MSNKKYHQFDAGTPTGTDIVLYGNPSTGALKKVPLAELIAELTTDHYSLDEQIWKGGKWIDGKDIYWRTFVWEGTEQAPLVNPLTLAGFSPNMVDTLIRTSQLSYKPIVPRSDIDRTVANHIFGSALDLSVPYQVTLPSSSTRAHITIWFTKP